MKKLLMLGLFSATSMGFASGLTEHDDVNTEAKRRKTNDSQTTSLHHAAPVGEENWITSHPTCLCPRPGGGYNLEERLSMVRNCLNGFRDEFWPEILELNKIGFFAGKVAGYDADVVNRLHKIFSNEGRGDNWDNVTLAFKNWGRYLFEDMAVLSSLMKQKDEQTTEIRNLLNDMQQSLIVVRRSVYYYSEHRNTYFSQLAKQ